MRGRALDPSRHPWGAVFLAVLSGLLYALSFPPAGLPLFAWVALVPLFLAVGRQPPNRAFLLGIVWCGTAGVGVAGFLAGTVAEFFGVSPLIGWGIFAGVFAVVSPLYGAYAAWVSWLARRGAAGAMLAAAGWGLCEYARSLVTPGGWALFAYSQVPLERVIQSVDLAGPFALGMLLAATSFCCAAWISPGLRSRRFAATALGVATLVAAVIVYGGWRLSQSFGTGEPVPVALVQGGLQRQLRLDPEQRDANLTRYLELTRHATRGHPELIFWPEHAVDFYLREETPHQSRLLRAVRQSRADLILGGPHYRTRSSPPGYYNSVFLIRDGRFAGRYDKMALLPFAESNPLQALLPRDVHYSPGESLRLLETSVLRVGAFLCSEALDPSLPRRLARSGAQLLANPANDDWFGGPAPARIHLYTAAARAIENRRYLVRTTPTGYSAIIDPHGRVTAVGDLGGAEVVVGHVRASHAVTLYQQIGEAPAWLALAIVVAGTARARWPRKRINGGTS